MAPKDESDVAYTDFIRDPYVLEFLNLKSTPNFHEKEWRKDKIGKKLYEKYKKCSGNSFEDGF